VRRRRALLTVALLGLLIVGSLFAFVYPTRTFLHQRDDLQTAERRLDVLRAQTHRLRAASKRLQGDAEVERIARGEYGLVRPGETSYVVVPAAPPPATPLP
jgi:cell division protein FtsB